MDLTVNPTVFKSLLMENVEALEGVSSRDIRPILPCLVRMSLICPLDSTRKCSEDRKKILTILSGIETVNSIVALLSIDFHALEIEVKREQQLRQKVGSAQSDSMLVQSLQNGLAMEFERSDPTRRLRLVLSDLLFILSQVQEEQNQMNNAGPGCQRNNTQENFVKHSDLFENAVYIPEICDVVNIALSELPALLSPVDIAETLLHVKHGPEIICWLVANSPDCFWEVCKSLVSNADKIDEDTVGGRIRTHALMLLCQMNPPMSLPVRAKCVESCRLAGLVVKLTLEHGGPDDTVAFVSSLLLGTDTTVRNWFATFLRTRQKRGRECVQRLRDILTDVLRNLVSDQSPIPESCLVQASSLLRLYCALRGIAAIKLQDEEMSLLVSLVTSRVAATAAGVRFVSLGLCMLIACPSLIGSHEAPCIDWVQWLVNEESYLEAGSGVTSSFGEMLLLMAIHFHSNQLSAISELVCSTLGIRFPIRPNNMTRMKNLFTQEIFTEQVVTAHAVKVPVTPNLSGNMTGFLPVHCIHQLLKSRAFTKHKVPIKDWIFRQICHCVAPLHPVLPGLVEVYVNSILVPGGLYDNTNQPILENEIKVVFSQSQMNQSDKTGGNLAPCLLLLYYVLLYEDVRLTTRPHNTKPYSQELLSQLPIKYLIHHAMNHQNSYSGLFPPLVRLLATHFPHLCLVSDWLESRPTKSSMWQRECTLSKQLIDDVFGRVTEVSCASGELLRLMLDTSTSQLWKHAETIVSHFRSFLHPSVPRYVQKMYREVWLKLNSLLPRSLWLMTIEALVGTKSTSGPSAQHLLELDPVLVLRCDPNIFRCGALLRIVLVVIEASLAGSSRQLARHAADTAALVSSGVGASGTLTDADREELRSALVAAQHSLAIQMLLEACLETAQDREVKGQMWALREVRGIICSSLHQAFISTPALAKLIHFQGYCSSLLPVTVAGVPSLHICLDFIPELLAQPDMEKQIFAVDLISHLAMQYSLPKSMSVAHLALNTLSTLLSVVDVNGRRGVVSAAVGAVARLTRAFPPLAPEACSLLIQAGRIVRAEEALLNFSDDNDYPLSQLISKAFSDILSFAVLPTDIY